jgi:hypothetical protein
MIPGIQILVNKSEIGKHVKLVAPKDPAIVRILMPSAGSIRVLQLERLVPKSRPKSS